ncbi:hypothetical protein EV356DRAFT_295034 [Viridothelium virens]|uniref:BZIP domain-containing protein n=1 Tax=Viridothelium virens TaxID=1048519 RepID=A0A6A6H0B9_VIRVR|nr:hypothetical protein EV356DRAFT_295034 [Viridothelium virens]
MGDLNEMADIDDIAKIDPDREGSSESIDSTPELETEGYQQEVPQPQKRKGGRKPIYATSEERKQRNRQAQAAFRERRTEYIKQLEHTIKQQEDSLQTLQQNHRTAADECLMLRYKNSLLERILLEKGIDVQAELRTKTGSPNLGPTPVPPSASGPPAQPPMQRALLNRHTQAQRNVAGLAPKLERPQIHTRQGVGVGATSNSPQQPTPSSHASSPSGVSVRSPGANPSGGVHSPTSIHLAQQQGQHPQPFRTHQSQTSQYQPLQPAISSSTSYTSPTVSSASGPGAANVVSGTGLYPSPFQNHYDQLEQEYDAQADMIDEDATTSSEPPRSAGVGPSSFPRNPGHQGSDPHQMGAPYGMPQQQIIPPGQPPPPMHHHHIHTSVGEAGPTFGAVNQLYDPSFDPLLDSDPFGLSASMHFPTQYQYEQQQQQEQRSQQ